jgi:hypothetical protein
MRQVQLDEYERFVEDLDKEFMRQVQLDEHERFMTEQGEY